MRLRNVATRAATLLRNVTRDPVSLTLAVVFAALVVVLLVRVVRRENWEFRGEKDELSDDHYRFIKRRCQGGMFFTQLIKDENLDFLAKYKENAAWKACNEGVQERKAAKGQFDGDASKCKSGKLCPILAMRDLRPCTNKAGTKCCNVDSRDCRPLESAGALNFTMVNEANADKDNQQFGADIDWAGTTYTWQGCKYRPKVYDRSKLPRVEWECGNEYKYETKAEEVRNLYSEARKYQCARSKACADAVKAYWAKHGNDAKEPRPAG